MDMLHCPGCKSEHITVHSRRKYFAWTVLCLLIILGSYSVLRIPLLRPGEWDTLKMLLILFCEVALCISLIMVVYYLVLGISKKHTSYTCRDCHHQFDDGLMVQHDSRRQH
ncbi:hypothetical protein ACPPVU_08950 [Mucilaginibacter sp. McL0603]|uniref:hypothetical protein n=1 Tax=Mucilaginibacter sp. McL0603 TaxID=3415670 RepID=UPI003CE774FA